MLILGDKEPEKAIKELPYLELGSPPFRATSHDGSEVLDITQFDLENLLTFWSLKQGTSKAYSPTKPLHQVPHRVSNQSPAGLFKVHDRDWYGPDDIFLNMRVMKSPHPLDAMFVLLKAPTADRNLD